MTYFKDYHPHTKYTANQPPFSTFILNIPPQIRLQSAITDDIKTNVAVGTSSIIKIGVDVLKNNAFLKLHENDRF